jgi:hypothetical protein
LSWGGTVQLGGTGPVEKALGRTVIRGDSGPRGKPSGMRRWHRLANRWAATSTCFGTERGHGGRHLRVVSRREPSSSRWTRRSTALVARPALAGHVRLDEPASAGTAHRTVTPFSDFRVKGDRRATTRCLRKHPSGEIHDGERSSSWGAADTWCVQLPEGCGLGWSSIRMGAPSWGGRAFARSPGRAAGRLRASGSILRGCARGSSRQVEPSYGPGPCSSRATRWTLRCS